MSTAVKLGFEPDVHDAAHQFIADQIRRQAEHVRVVVTTGQFRRQFIVAKRRAYAGDLVGHDRHADPASTEEDAPVRVAVANGTSCRICRIRIIEAAFAVRSEFDQFITPRLQHGLDTLQSVTTAVIVVHALVRVADGDARTASVSAS